MQQTATKEVDPTAGMTVEQEIEYARENGWNLLLPTTNIGGLSEFHKPVTDKVTLSPDPKENDVYPGTAVDDVPYFRIHAQGLHKLSLCAGIQWDPMQCRRTDDGSDRDYVSYAVLGGIRKADGTMLWVPGNSDIDMEVEEEEIFAGHYKRANTWKKAQDQKDAYVRDATKKDLLYKRKHKLKLVETGAMNRVVRKILALKPQYSKEELLKPFLVIRIVLQPNFSDREFRQRMMDASIQAITGIYGPPATRQLPAPAPGDVIDIPLAEGPTADPEPPPETEPDNAESGGNPSALEVFLSNENVVRIRHIEDLAKKKDVDLKEIVTVAWKDFTDENFTKLFEHLMEQPDPEIDDDIPF
jgi:hypothetical protein